MRELINLYDSGRYSLLLHENEGKGDATTQILRQPRRPVSVQQQILSMYRRLLI